MENVGEIVGTGASTVFQVNSLSADILAGLALVLKIITETRATGRIAPTKDIVTLVISGNFLFHNVNLEESCLV